MKKRKLGKLTINEWVSDLQIIAHERNTFVKKLEQLDSAFTQRLKDFKRVAEIKAKEGLELVKIQMTELFKKEWEHLVTDFNRMRVIT